jgi:beta-lactamase regulating signal transducer with metallopeptidase domain
MNEIRDICVVGLNDIGREFCKYASGVLVQTCMLVAILLCVDWFLRRRVRATIRYWIWMLVFVKLLLPPSLCVPTGIGYWLGRHTSTAPFVLPQPIENAPIPAFVEVGVPTATPVTQPSEPVLTPASTAAFGSEPITWQGGVFLFWTVGVLVFGALVVQRWRFVKGLIAQGEPATDDQVDLLDRCRRRMGVHGKVGLRLLPNAFSPAVCGLLRPTILAPRALLDRLRPEGLRAVLIHELAHVKRGDLWINSFQTILQVAYFYNPLIWLASAIVRRVREQAVDEMVLVALGAEAKSYGNTLIDIAEMAFLRTSPALRLIGVAESRKSLEGRIKHMITKSIPKSAKVGAIGVLFVAAIGAILLPMARAQKQDVPVVAVQEAPGPFVTTVPDGTTVELVALCVDPTVKGQQWWRPDGTLMEEPKLGFHLWGKPEYPAVSYLWKVRAARELTFISWSLLENLSYGTGQSDADGLHVQVLGDNQPLIKPLPDQTDIKVDVAGGDWQVYESQNDGTSYRVAAVSIPAPEGATIVLSGLRPDPREEKFKTLIEMTNVSNNLEIDLKCTTTDGRTMGTVSDPQSQIEGRLVQRTFSIATPIQNVKSIVVRYRPLYHPVFRNVSLRPGRKTDVRVGDAEDISGGAFGHYEVNRSVADFPAGEDFSTPEAAYSTINRMDWDDSSAWRKVSVARKAARMGGSGSEPQRTTDPEWVKVLANARIREVLVWNMTRAAVIGELPQELSSKKIVEPFDRRSFELENGRWLNTGNSRFNSIEEAKAQFMGWMKRETAQADAMRDPLAHSDEIQAAAVQLFDKLRTADYAEILSHYRNGKWDSGFWKVCPTSGLYTVQTDYPSFVLWCCTHFKDNPIVGVQLGDVFLSDALVFDKTGRPTVPYKLVLKDGSTLAGNLPFEHETAKGQGKWIGLGGIDWHLWSSGTSSAGERS